MLNALAVNTRDLIEPDPNSVIEKPRVTGLCTEGSGVPKDELAFKTGGFKFEPFFLTIINS